jgi:hypothetical protein
MLSGLSGLVPSVGAAAKAAVENAQKDPKAETPAQRAPEAAAKPETTDKPVPAKTNS